MHALEPGIGEREEFMVNEKFLFAELLNPDTVWYIQWR